MHGNLLIQFLEYGMGMIEGIDGGLLPVSYRFLVPDSSLENKKVI